MYIILYTIYINVYVAKRKRERERIRFDLAAIRRFVQQPMNKRMGINLYVELGAEKTQGA